MEREAHGYIMTLTKTLRKIRTLYSIAFFFWLPITATDSIAITIYGGVGTDEAKKLDKLISDYKYSAQDLKNALYPGIDLSRVIRYCDRAKYETNPGTNKEFTRCFTPLGVAFMELGRSGKKERDSLLLDKMKVLVENGASVENDPPVLFYAILDNRLDMVSFILEKGIDVNKLGARVHIQPGFANQGYFLATAEPLVQRSCNENEFRPEERIIDSSGYMYPIHCAAAGGSHEMLDLLLAHGADCTLKDNFGRTVLQWAQARGDHDNYFAERIQQTLPQPERKGPPRVLIFIIICIILLALFICVKGLLRPSRKGVSSRTASLQPSRTPGIPPRSSLSYHANNKMIAPSTKNGLVFSAAKKKVKSRSSLGNLLSMKKLIILIIIVGVGFFWCSSMQRKAKALTMQSSVFGAIANGRLKEAIAKLEENEKQMKRPEDYLACGYAYATVAEYVKKFNWRPQSNPPNADSVYAKAVDIMQRGIAIAKPDQAEVIYLYLSGICWKKGDVDGQIQSIEQASLTTKSIARKSFYCYYNSMRCLERVRYRDQTRQDTLLKEKGWKYLEEAVQLYPQNYEALMYMSKNAESKSQAADFYEKAKAALPIYEEDAKKEHIYSTIKLLATFNPYR